MGSDGEGSRVLSMHTKCTGSDATAQPVSNAALPVTRACPGIGRVYQPTGARVELGRVALVPVADVAGQQTRV